MTRITALLIAAIALATGAYLWWASGDGVAVEQAADTVGEAAGEALDSATEALTDAPANDGAAPAQPEAGSGVAAGRQAETDGAATEGPTTDGAAAGALPETDPGAEAAVDALDPPVAGAAGATLPEGYAPELLTAEGFDAARVRALIAEANLGDLQKSTLTSALDAAARGEATLADVLDQIRAVFGL